MEARSLFQGLKVLLVEDETIVSLLIEDMLRTLGCAAVWHATGVGDALAILRDRRPDAAVLDLNLAGISAAPIAERLEAASIPFVFASGYGRGGVPEQWAARPAVQKPFRLGALAAALRSVLTS